jgi:hypothetical protein
MAESLDAYVLPDRNVCRLIGRMADSGTSLDDACGFFGVCSCLLEVEQGLIMDRRDPHHEQVSCHVTIGFTEADLSASLLTRFFSCRQCTTSRLMILVHYTISNGESWTQCIMYTLDRSTT